jgi:hypothetical protein
MLPRKEKIMSNQRTNSDLRDRVMTLESELKRTQKLVNEDMKKLYRLIEETRKAIR